MVLISAVAILTVIKRPSTPPHTLLVSQFRPPVGQVVIELPAGLIDAGEEGEEGAKRAALRELAEETGYSSEAQGATVSVRSISDIIHNDPGLTGANMKLCIIDIALEDDAPEPVSQPDEGEYIDLHLVPLHSLQSHLQGMLAIFLRVDFAHKGFAIDARLSHLAAGLALAAQLA